MSERKQRTLNQNSAMHLYFQRLAEELNLAGLDMKTVLKPEIDIPWTKESVKIHLWKPILQIMEGKDSTTEMNTCDPSEIYEVLNRHIAEKFGVSVPWPTEGEQIT